MMSSPSHHQSNEVRRILIMESYSPTCHALAMTLRREGWEVDLTETDHEALKALEQEMYNVILLDVDVPTGDGWRVLLALQAAHNTIPVVVLIGTEGSSGRQARVLGACSVLSKPVGREVLLSSVMQALVSPSDTEPLTD
jgi:two-component system OmpR family response regulator